MTRFEYVEGWWDAHNTVSYPIVHTFTSPIQPGQIVYLIEYLPCSKKYMIRQLVASFVCHGLNSWFVLDNDLNRLFYDSDWGKKVFSTIEEAESALQGIFLR